MFEGMDLGGLLPVAVDGFERLVLDLVIWHTLSKPVSMRYL